MRHVIIIIPTLEPTARIVGLVDDLRCQGFEHIVIVDDGSDERIFAPIFESLERRGCQVLHHGSNLGKGAAIKTGISHARASFPLALGFITVDGDGQHLACDVRALAERAEQLPGALVLGTRSFSEAGVPLRSRLGNAVSSLAFKLACGVACADTQTGLRVIPRGLADEALSCPGERFEYEMAFLMLSSMQGRAIEQVRISTVYLDANKGSHFDAIHDSARVMRMVAQMMRLRASLLATREGACHAA